MKREGTLKSNKRVSPWLLGVDHVDWRPFQYEAVEGIVDIFENRDIAILEAPTGTGKTAIATAVSGLNNSFSKTTVVVQNLGLLEQYKDYGFSILKGKQAYPCVYKKRVDEWVDRYDRVPSAAECPYAEMYQCPAGSDCPYMKAREKAFASSRMACTYKYAALSQKVQDRGGLFIMDEIHNAVNEILSIGSFTMADYKRKELELPEFPLKDFANGDGGIVDSDNLVLIMEWIMRSMRCLGTINLFDEITPEGTEKKKMLERFQSLVELLSVCRGEVFYKCSKVDKWYNGRKTSEWFIEFKTISPSYLYHKMTSSKDKVLMMSATVGSPSALIAGEMRIQQDNFGFLRFPHPVPHSKRPIYDIADWAMSYSNISKSPWIYDGQAKKIAQWIQTYTRPEWRGIVLTTSHKKIDRLRSGLAKYLGEKRIFANEKESLQERIDEFMNDKTPSLVHVDTIQGWGTGVDLRGDIARYCVVAGVPFPNPTDAFEKIRMETRTGKAYASAFAFNAVMQAAGRVTRGNMRNGEYILNLGAIADKLATSPFAKIHYSDWFKEALIKPDWRNYVQ